MIKWWKIFYSVQNSNHQFLNPISLNFSINYKKPLKSVFKWLQNSLNSCTLNLSVISSKIKTAFRLPRMIFWPNIPTSFWLLGIIKKYRSPLTKIDLAKVFQSSVKNWISKRDFMKSTKLWHKLWNVWILKRLLLKINVPSITF
jgi:hypothetical protein